jgi:CIC family chloride channel protein
MMRKDIATIPAGASIAEFRRRFPLGSTSRAILVDGAGRYAGLVMTASAYADNAKPDARLIEFAVSCDATLQPEMNIEDVMRVFDRTETEELAVVDGEGKVLGLLAQPYVSRRYARELEKVQMDLFGET